MGAILSLINLGAAIAVNATAALGNVVNIILSVVPH